MFERFGKNQPDDIDDLIKIVTDSMRGELPGSEKYKELLTTLERLNNLKENKSHEKISRDIIVTTTGNLLGILLIVAYEQKHVMTTKAFGWIRPK